MSMPLLFLNLFLIMGASGCHAISTELILCLLTTALNLVLKFERLSEPNCDEQNASLLMPHLKYKFYLWRAFGISR